MKKMKTPLSPSDIEVLIWCYCRRERHPREDAPAVADALTMFQDAGMVDEMRDDSGAFLATSKGSAMIEALRNTQEPRCVWVDQDGAVLAEEKK